MSKILVLSLAASGALMVSSAVWAQNATGQTGQTMMNNNDAAAGSMQNGAMQNGNMKSMPASPSANGGTLKDSAEAKKQMMQQNTGQ